MFVQRVRAAASRLQISLEPIRADEARRRPWSANDVIVLQGTLRPAQQQALVEYLTQLDTPPVVIAVTGHLETALRERLKAAGARLAAHSAMDRVLARALGINVPGADGAHDPDDQPPRRPS